MQDHDSGLDRLVAQAQRGDELSRNELLRAIRVGVLRYLLARGLPDHDAQDLAQEACLGVLHALPTWRAAGPTVWAYAFAVTRNKIADRARSRTKQRDVPMDDATLIADVLTDSRPGPADLVEHDEGARNVQALIEALPPTQREVLLLRVIVGLSAAETATALHLTVGSVRVLQYRAITTLRNRLTPGTEEKP
jgi:RNA polymerase sigma-70 factor (ECF subfamily)